MDEEKIIEIMEKYDLSYLQAIDKLEEMEREQVEKEEREKERESYLWDDTFNEMCLEDQVIYEGGLD